MNPLKDRISEAVLKSIENIGTVGIDLPIRIEYSRDEKFGDYACTIAMDREWRSAAAAVHPEFTNPRKFAEAIVKSLQSAKGYAELFDSAEIAGPGFINLRLTPSLLEACTREAVREGTGYGRTARSQPKSIIFEFVSANPTGPLNIVSARSAALGDSCCNLLEAAGDRVHREYYVNDYGNQVDLLGRSCLLRMLESEGAKLKFAIKDQKGDYSYPAGPGLPFPPEGYHGEYLIEIVQLILGENPGLKPPADVIRRAKELSKRSDNAGDPIEQLELASLADDLGKRATEYFLSTHKLDLSRFRVRFDGFYSERSLHESHEVLAAKDRLGERVFTDGEGKILFRSTDYGDDKDRVIVRDDGRPTYLLADIAYHYTKIKRKFDRIYNIWGPDHHGYIARLAGAMQAMGYPSEDFRVLIAQQVNLLEDGKPVVMSKRTGKFITMKTLIEEIPIDVTRYFFVMRSFEAHLDFDFNLARDTSEKNPYYYVAYAHARIRSIFRKAAERGLIPAEAVGRPELLLELKSSPIEMTEERRRLYWLVARLPEEVRDAADSIEPHRIVNYLYSLATALSRFYAPTENRIIDQEPSTAVSLLILLGGVAACLKNGLGLLGMEAPERMTREEV
jgi:arginyl-tRNA synthetase